MNIFQAFKLYSTGKNAVSQLQEAFMQGGHSWGSTRFWLTAGTILTAVWGSVKGFVPQPYASYVEISATAVYVIAETVRKVMTAVQAAKAGQVVDVTTIKA